jgi:hypothetical protein
MTPKGANLQATDLLEISELSGTGYITKSITGQEIINAGGGGGSQNLQQVTDIGNDTTNGIITTSSFVAFDDISSPDNYSVLSTNCLELGTNSTGEQLFLFGNNIEFVRGGGSIGKFKATNITSPNNVTLEFPNKTTGSYTIATTADIPSVSGFVPYTGATANVNLGTFHLDAGKGTFNHNGSTDTLTANHTSGSGIGLLITKGGANEGLKVNKTSGSGNAATIIGTLEATTLVKTGGTSSQFLMADGSTLNFFRLDFTPSSVVTATTSETQVGVLMIPANSIKTIDQLKFFAPIVKIGGLSTCTVTLKLSTSATMPIGTTDRIATFVGTAGNRWLPMMRNPQYNGGNLIITATSTTLVSDLVATSVDASVIAIDRTVNQYLYVSVTLANASDSAYLAGGYITNM